MICRPSGHHQLSRLSPSARTKGSSVWASRIDGVAKAAAAAPPKKERREIMMSPRLKRLDLGSFRRRIAEAAVVEKRCGCLPGLARFRTAMRQKRSSISESRPDWPIGPGRPHDQNRRRSGIPGPLAWHAFRERGFHEVHDLIAPPQKETRAQQRCKEWRVTFASPYIESHVL